MNSLDDEVKDFLSIDKEKLKNHSISIDQRLQNFRYSFIERLIRETKVFIIMNSAIQKANKEIGKEFMPLDDLGIMNMVMNIWGNEIIDELEKNNPDFKNIIGDIVNKQNQ